LNHAVIIEGHKRVRAVFCGLALPERRVEKSNWKGGSYMAVYDTLTLLFNAGIFFLALLVYIEMKNTKK